MINKILEKGKLKLKREKAKNRKT